MDFSDEYEYDGVWYVRESHSGSGIHWHKKRLDGGKNWELLGPKARLELEKQYIREQKLKRVLKNND